MMDEAEGHAGAPAARTVRHETLYMLGGPLDLVASIEAPAGDAVLFRSRMVAGSTVPLHSHVDPECFLVLEGEIEAFADDGQGWRTIVAGGSVSMENGVAHSVRAGSSGADLLVTTNHRLAAFFRDAQRQGGQGGQGGSAGPPDAKEIAHVVEVAGRYGYWMASPDEHSKVTGRPLGR